MDPYNTLDIFMAPHADAHGVQKFGKFENVTEKRYGVFESDLNNVTDCYLFIVVFK